MTPPPNDIALTFDSAALPSLGQAHRSIHIPRPGGSFWKKLCAFAGPGYLIAVGYMDPGNWATDLAGGSAFGYSLLSVILISNLMAMVLQALSAKLGIATGMDLAQACSAQYPPNVRRLLWLLCEVAIIACDLAEVIGTAIALQLLLGIPLVFGVLLTGLDTLIVLALQQHGFRKLEALVVSLLLLTAGCFAVELVLARPGASEILAGLVPGSRIISDPNMLYFAIAILGATVMPHNLYLHSSIVQTRQFERTTAGKSEAIRFATLDSSAALVLAMLVNAAILILAASTFHAAGHVQVAEIQQAYHLLPDVLGATFASTLFAIALLAAGQNSTVTATLAGQIVMQGFLDIRLPPWLQRLATRALAIVPAALVAGLYGSSGTARLLILSQVILSLQLPFAVVPLVRFTSDRRLMGPHANPLWLKVAGYAIAGVIITLNLALLFLLPTA